LVKLCRIIRSGPVFLRHSVYKFSADQLLACLQLSATDQLVWCTEVRLYDSPTDWTALRWTVWLAGRRRLCCRLPRLHSAPTAARAGQLLVYILL